MYFVIFLKVLLLFSQEGFFQSTVPNETLPPAARSSRTGDKTCEANYPFVVEVIGGLNGCAGTLITRQLVLTSAHCIDRNRAGEGRIFVESKYSEPTMRREASIARLDARLQKSLSSTALELRYDFAIIVVKEPFIFGKAVNQAPLPKPGFTATCKTATLLVTKSVPLKCVTVELANLETCRQSYNGSVLDDSLLCSKEGGPGCSSHGGQPLLCKDGQKDVIIGIISSRVDCSIVNKSLIFNKIESYLGMINQNIEDFGGAGAPKEEEDDGNVPPAIVTETTKSFTTAPRIFWELIWIAVGLCLM